MSAIKYNYQECPECGRYCKILYKPSWESTGEHLCYWCNERRVKKMSLAKK
jgi:hypothetical protein